MGKKSLYKKFLQHIENDTRNASRIPKQLHLKTGCDPGFFFGGLNQFKKDRFIGMPQGEDGNIAVIGGSGSGKSTSIAEPTMRHWKGAMCVTDIKGELSEYYKKLYQKGLVTRPYIVFDPTDEESLSYDPFDFLLWDDKANLISNVEEMASIIIPKNPNVRDPFWDDTERDLLKAALLHFFVLGCSFSQTLCLILDSTASKLCVSLDGTTDEREKKIMGSLSEMKKEALAYVDRGAPQ